MRPSPSGVTLCRLEPLPLLDTILEIVRLSDSRHSARSDHARMMQVARKVTDMGDGFLCGKRYLTLDRDAKCTDDFWRSLSREGVEVICLPVRASNLNAYAERFVGTRFAGNSASTSASPGRIWRRSNWNRGNRFSPSYSTP